MEEENYAEVQTEVRAIETTADNDQSFQSGLELRCEIDAESAEQAVQRARPFAEGMLSFFGLVTGVGLPPAEPFLAFETSPEKDRRQFIQYFYPPHSHVSRRLVDVKVFDRVHEAIERVGDGDRGARLARSLRWYRLAAREADALDRFSYRWLGLETLNPILMERLGVGPSTQECPECRHERRLPDSAGIKALCVGHFPDGMELFKGLRDFRVALQHGFGDLREMYGQAAERAHQAREALALAILTLLGLDDLIETVLQTEITNAVPTRLAVRAELVGGNPQDLGPEGMDPQLVIDKIDETIEADETGEVKLTVSPHFTAVLGEGVQMAVEGYDLRAEADRIEFGRTRKL